MGERRGEEGKMEIEKRLIILGKGGGNEEGIGVGGVGSREGR
jgi:hypothetical protein